MASTGCLASIAILNALRGLMRFCCAFEKMPRILMTDRGAPTVTPARSDGKERASAANIKRKPLSAFREIGAEDAPRAGPLPRGFEPPTYHHGRAYRHFLCRRFSDMDWRILTPDVFCRVREWGSLSFREGQKSQRCPEDASEGSCGYLFPNIFYPARLMVQKAIAVQRCQKILEETCRSGVFIPQMIADAPARARWAMAEAHPRCHCAPWTSTSAALPRINGRGRVRKTHWPKIIAPVPLAPLHCKRPRKLYRRGGRWTLT